MNNNNYQELLPCYNLADSVANFVITTVAAALVLSPDAVKRPMGPCLFSAGAILLTSSSVAHRAGIISVETTLKLKVAATAALTAASFVLHDSAAKQKQNPSL